MKNHHLNVTSSAANRSLAECRGTREAAFIDFGADMEWQLQALCAQTDPEVFFPEKGGSTREAKRTCMACDVRDQCLTYALDKNERYGIWGGLSERERRKIISRGTRTQPETEPMPEPESVPDVA